MIRLAAVCLVAGLVVGCGEGAPADVLQGAWTRAETNETRTFNADGSYEEVYTLTDTWHILGSYEVVGSVVRITSDTLTVGGTPSIPPELRTCTYAFPTPGRLTLDCEGNSAVHEYSRKN